MKARNGIIAAVLVMMLSVVAFSPQVSALRLVTKVSLKGPPNYPALDSVNGFAYFPLDTSPGQIVKFNLLTSKIVSTLVLSENSFPWGSAIDVQHQAAYFTLIGNLSYVVKVDLTSFKEVGSILIQGQPFAIAIDVPNQVLYVGNFRVPGIVWKIDLTKFAMVSQLTLPTGDNYVISGFVDSTDGFVFFALRIAPTTIVKISTSTFKFAGKIVTSLPGINVTGTGNYADAGYVSSTFDPVKHLAYFGTHGNPALVSIVNASTSRKLNTITTNVAVADSLTLDSVNNNLYVGSIIGGVMAVGEVSLATNTQTTSIKLSTSSGGNVHGAVLFQGFLYVSLHNSTAPAAAKVSVP